MVIDVGGRVALTEYKDAGDAVVSQIRTPLTSDINAYSTQLNALFASSGAISRRTR